MLSHDIFTFLKDHYQVHAEHIANIDCKRIQLGIDDLQLHEKEAIFVYPPEETPSEVSPNNLYIICGDGKLSNVIYYQSPNDFKSIISDLHKFLVDPVRLAEATMELQKIFGAMDNYNDVLDACGRILNNPLLFIDTSYKYLASYPNEPIGFDKFDTVLENRYAPKDYIDLATVIQIYSGKHGLFDTQVFRMKYHDHEFCAATIGVFTKHHVFGGLELLEKDKTIDETDIAILNQVASLMPLIFESNTNIDNISNSQYTPLLMDLLMMKTSDMPLLQKRINEFSIFQNTRFFIGCLSLNFPISCTSVVFLNELSDFFETGMVYQFQDTIMLLVREADMNFQQFSKKCHDFALERHMPITISLPFSDLIYLKANSELAFYEMEYLSAKNQLPQDISFVSANYPELLLAHQLHTPEYCVDGVKALYDYDEEHHSEFFSTLEIFLDCAMNYREAGSLMNLHRSSLIYRVTKACDIANLDLENLENQRNFLLGMKLFKLNLKTM